jgi:hypothetical protein
MTSNGEPGNQQPPLNPVVVKTTSRTTIALQVFTAIVLCVSSWITFNNFRIQQSWTMETRKHQIAPDIDIRLDQCGYLPYDNADLMQICFANIGGGTAKGVTLRINYADSFLPAPITIFELSDPKYHIEQNHISPDQWLKCEIDLHQLIPRFDTLSNFKQARRSWEFTLYITYFDIDGTEYLVIEKLRPSDHIKTPKTPMPEDDYNSKLLNLSKEVPLYVKKVIENPNIHESVD